MPSQPKNLQGFAGEKSCRPEQLDTPVNIIHEAEISEEFFRIFPAGFERDSGLSRGPVINVTSRARTSAPRTNYNISLLHFPHKNRRKTPPTERWNCTCGQLRVQLSAKKKSKMYGWALVAPASTVCTGRARCQYTGPKQCTVAATPGPGPACTASSTVLAVLAVVLYWVRKVPGLPAL